MTKNKRDQSYLSISKRNQPIVERKEELPELDPTQSLPNKPIAPARPDENLDPASPDPGINKHELNYPTRIYEFPSIFNNK